MATGVLITQIILGVILTIVIILQAKGAGLSASFGSGGSFYSARRGIEKLLLSATIVIATLFAVVSLTSILLF